MVRTKLIGILCGGALSAGIAAEDASWSVSHPEGLQPLNFSSGELNEALGKTEGFAKVEFEVDKDGRAANIVILESTSEDLAEAAVSSIESSSYRNVGEPTRHQVTYTSTLDKASHGDR